MTTQDLKNNRTEIINFINEREYDLKFAMGMAVELCGNCDLWFPIIEIDWKSRLY